MDLAQRLLIARARFRYALDRNLGGDPRSRRQFAAERPILGGTPARILADLMERGVAVAALDELLGRPDPGRWAAIVAIAGRYLQEALGRMGAEPRTRFGGVDGRNNPGARGVGAGPAVAIDDPLFRLGLEPCVLDVVNSFFGLRSKLNQYSLRLSMPRSENLAPRQSAQAWHRDQWGQVKVFLYLTDVDEGNGALEYIPASRRGGRHAGLCPMPAGHGADGYLHPPEAQVEARVPREDRVCCASPIGSVVFCDTSGLHRGGYALDRPRLIATWAYYRPSAQVLRDFRCLEDGKVGPLTPAAAHALS
jgi:hypothetical protein